MSGFDDARVINTRHGAFTFSRIEIRDITISVLVLTAAFTIIFGDWKLFSDDFVVNTVFWIVSSFLMVILSFMLHELGHKFTAQRFGAWSEYRMYPVGLIICLIGSLFGILFAAPGAVYIRGYITDEMNGKISVESEYKKGSVFTVSIPQKVISDIPVTDMNGSAQIGRAHV